MPLNEAPAHPLSKMWAGRLPTHSNCLVYMIAQATYVAKRVLLLNEVVDVSMMPMIFPLQSPIIFEFLTLRSGCVRSRSPLW